MISGRGLAMDDVRESYISEDITNVNSDRLIEERLDKE